MHTRITTQSIVASQSTALLILWPCSSLKAFRQFSRIFHFNLVVRIQCQGFGGWGGGEAPTPTGNILSASNDQALLHSPRLDLLHTQPLVTCCDRMDERGNSEAPEMLRLGSDKLARAVGPMGDEA